MIRKYIENTISPKLQGDGGWIEVVDYTNHHLKVYLRGECSKCNIAPKCMDWIIDEIKRDLNEEITITMVRKKPYFWDNAL